MPFRRSILIWLMASCALPAAAAGQTFARALTPVQLTSKASPQLSTPPPPGPLANTTIDTGGSDQTYATPITGTDRLVKLGTGTLTLTGVNTYSGTTDISVGTLTAGAAGAFSNFSAFTINGGATLSLGTSPRQTIGSLAGSGTVQLGAGTLTTGNDNTSTFYGGQIFGTGGLTKVGTGTMTLSNTASYFYSGPTTVNGGTLRYSGPNGGNGQSDMIVGPTGTLDVSSGVFATTVGSLSGAGNVVLGSKNLVVCGHDNSTTTFSGVISGSGGLTVCGRLTLSGANTFTGDTYVAGTLRLVGTNELSPDSNVYGPGTLIIAGSQEIRGGLVNGISLTSDRVVLENGSLTFGRGNVDFGISHLSGTGTLIKEGTGTLSVASVNSDFVGLIRVNGGTLRPIAAPNVFSASAAYSIASGATMDLRSDFHNFDQTIGSLDGGGNVLTGSSRLTTGGLNTDTTFSGVISGGGGLTKTGTGVFTLSGVNTYTGSTLITSGMLRTGVADALATSSSVDISAGATLDLGGFNQSLNTISGAGTIQLSASTFTLGGNDTSSTFAGTVAGSGAVVKSGSGTLRLSGASNYAGQTSVNGGSIQALAAGTLSANSNYLIASGTTLDLNNFAQTIGSLGGAGTVQLGSATLTAGGSGAATTFSGLITGSGGVVKTGAGVMTFASANNYTGGTTIRQGALQGTTSTLLGAFQNDAALIFDQGFDGTFSGFVNGTGGVVKTGTGVLTFASANSYSGGTTIRQGAIRGTSSTLLGGFQNDATLIFDQGIDGTFSGFVSGTGGVVKTGTGVLTFASANSYSGGTTIRQGAIRGTSSTLLGGFQNDATLIFDQGFDGTFSGALTGSGSVVKRGAGMLRFTGAYTSAGGLSIESGGVWLDGTFTGNTSVLGGSTLLVSSNASIVGGLNASGLVHITFTAGSGRLDVSQGVQFNSGTLSVDVNAAGGSGRLVAGGAATFSNSQLQINRLAGTYARTTSYGIVQASSFSGVPTITGLQSSIRPYLTVHGGLLVLTLIDQSAALAGVGTSANSRSVGAAFDKLRPAATGEAARVASELAALDDASLDQALNAISGEIYATSVHLVANDSENANETVRSVLQQRSMARGDRAATINASHRMPFWFTAAHQRAAYDADPTNGAHGAAINLDGGVAGADRSVGRWTIGAAGGYSSGRLTLTGLTDTNETKIWRGMAYAERALGGSLISFGVSDARMRATVRRAVAIAAAPPTTLAGSGLLSGVNVATGSVTSAWSQDAWTAARHPLTRGAWTFEPSVNARYARYTVGDINEADAGMLALHSSAAAIESWQGGAGLRLARDVRRTRSFVSVEYQRELGKRDANVALTLSDANRTGFSADGIAFSPNVITSQVGMMFSARRADISLHYDGRFSDTSKRHTLQLSVLF